MAVIKKTVAIHPIMDGYIRKTWAILIEGGYDASYSTALNFMLLCHILTVADKETPRKVGSELNSFLADEKSIRDLNIEDFANKVDEMVDKRDRLRDLK